MLPGTLDAVPLVGEKISSSKLAVLVVGYVEIGLDVNPTSKRDC